MLEQLQTIDAVYKDARPMDTVERIKGILDEYGIRTVVTWGESNVPNCYSLRVNIEGTRVGTNGKGVTKEFALASGYGEFMERLQQGLIWRNKVQTEGNVSSSDAQSQPVSAEMLLERNPGWYAAYCQKLRRLTGISLTEKQIMAQYADGEGNVRATPFYCVTSGTTEYVPAELIKGVYGTNGGAAGNTLEEAIVQAISEIVERSHKLRVIFEGISVPEIPETVLQTCPIAYEIIGYLRNNGYRVIIKDCSLGTKFPVVCVCLVNTKTGKYHTHFGAHPNFEVALQRTLTETFQGRNIKHITRHEGFYYPTDNTFELRYLMTELVKGTSEKPPQFFFGRSEQPYSHAAGFSGRNNSECLRECINFFKEQGYDVLVRDSSCLGFPTCQVIVPGYSEALPHRLSSKYNDMRYHNYAKKTLRNPVTAGPEDMLGLMMYIMERNKYSISGMDSFLAESGIPACLTPAEEVRLMNLSLAYVSYSQGKKKDAVTYIGKALLTEDLEEEEYLICLKRYLSLQLNGYGPENIKDTLTFLHKPETVGRLYEHLDKRENPLNELVLRCDMQCRSDCRLYGLCKQKQADELVQLIINKSREVDQSKLIGYLKTVCQ